MIAPCGKRTSAPTVDSRSPLTTMHYGYGTSNRGSQLASKCFRNPVRVSGTIRWANAHPSPATPRPSCGPCTFPKRNSVRPRFLPRPFRRGFRKCWRQLADKSLTAATVRFVFRSTMICAPAGFGLSVHHPAPTSIKTGYFGGCQELLGQHRSQVTCRSLVVPHRRRFRSNSFMPVLNAGALPPKIPQAGSADNKPGWTLFLTRVSENPLHNFRR